MKVAYRHGEEYSFEFTLVNHSRWPTRILGFSDSRSGLLRTTNVALTDNATTAHPVFTPFRPFRIGGGESKVVRVTNRFEGCAFFGPNSAATLTESAIRHRTLWATRTHFVDLPTRVQVPAPDSCPER